MFDQHLIAEFLIFCLILFFSVHLFYDLRMIRSRKRRNVAVIGPPRPRGGPTLVAYGASYFFWLLFFISPGLLFIGAYESVFAPLIFQFLHQLWIQLVGACLIIMGVLLADLGRISRGIMAPSWAMPENYQLVTTGAYGLVRHPLYFSSILMSLGLFFLLSNILLLGCFIGLLCYYFPAKKEEEMLLERFGRQYKEYKSRVGMFFPKIRKKDQ